MSEILGIFGVDWRLLLVQTFNFGLLLAILWYFLYRPVISLLEKRQAAITEGVLNAERAGKELAEITVQKEAILTEAGREGDSIVERAKERALIKEETIIREAEERGVRLMEEARDRAQEGKRRAREESKEELARLAILSAEKILRGKTN